MSAKWLLVLVPLVPVAAIWLLLWLTPKDECCRRGRDAA